MPFTFTLIDNIIFDYLYNQFKQLNHESFDYSIILISFTNHLIIRLFFFDY
jgi:hypothetical protein